MTQCAQIVNSCHAYRIMLTLATVTMVLMAAKIEKKEEIICRTKFDDSASSTQLAKMVITGMATQRLAIKNSSNFFYKVKISKILKGPNITSSFLVLGQFSSKGQLDVCIGVKLKIDSEYIFYLNRTRPQNVENGEGKYYPISAIPELLNEKKLKAVKSMVCGRSKCGSLPTVLLTPSQKVVEKFLEDKFEFTCSFSGRPTPKISWLKDGLILETNLKAIVKHNTEGAKKNSTLYIQKLSARHGGVYTCEASNIYSTARQSVQLIAIKPHSTQCPAEMEGFCFNGGTCYQLPMGQKYCHCTKEYVGTRCHEFNLQTRKIEEKPSVTSVSEKCIIIGLIIALMIVCSILLFVTIRCLIIRRQLNDIHKTNGKIKLMSENHIQRKNKIGSDSVRNSYIKPSSPDSDTISPILEEKVTNQNNYPKNQNNSNNHPSNLTRMRLDANSTLDPRTIISPQTHTEQEYVQIEESKLNKSSANVLKSNCEHASSENNKWFSDLNCANVIPDPCIIHDNNHNCSDKSVTNQQCNCGNNEISLVQNADLNRINLDNIKASFENLNRSSNFLSSNFSLSLVTTNI